MFCDVDSIARPRSDAPSLRESILVATIVSPVVAPDGSHGHRGSEHSPRTQGGALGRLEERWHGCRNHGTLTASAGDDGPTRSQLHDRRGHVAMGAAAAERAR